MSVLRPGAVQPKPDDEYEVDYCFGEDATAEDIRERSLEKLLAKVCEGFNGAIMVFGAKGSGKTAILQGKEGAQADEGKGLVELAADALYEAMHKKAKDIGERAAIRRRGASAAGFDFFVESSLLEIVNDEIKDLYSIVNSNLPVHESVDEGIHVKGLSRRAAATADELREHFQGGVELRGDELMDLGPVHHRAVSIFTVRLTQHLPAEEEGETDQNVVSQLVFIDTPGAEKLGMDPTIVKAREGVIVNKSLFALGNLVRGLTKPLGDGFGNYKESKFTHLLSDVLGGSSYTVLVGTLSVGEWETSINTLQYMALFKKIQNFPIANNDSNRLLAMRDRARILQMNDQQSFLASQLDDMPAIGDPNEQGMMQARIHDFERRLIEEREQNAAHVADKEALQIRLNEQHEEKKAYLEEKAEFQEALIKSEQERLEVSRALIDLEVDYNSLDTEFEATKFKLEQRILELEAAQLEADIKQTEASRIQNELEVHCNNLEGAKQALEKELEEVRQELQGTAEERDALVAKVAELEAQKAAAEETARSYKADAEKCAMLTRQLQEKTREQSETAQALAETQAELDRVGKEQTKTKVALEEAREAHGREMESLLHQISDLSKAIHIGLQDPLSNVMPSSDDVGTHAELLARHMGELHQEQEHGLREELEDLQARYNAVTRRFRALYTGYRELRYQVEDAGGEIAVVHENELSEGPEDPPPGEQESRREAMELEDSLAKLQKQLKIQTLRNNIRRSTPERNRSPRNYDVLDVEREKVVAEAGLDRSVISLAAENAKLKAESEILKRRPSQTPEDEVRRENESLKATLREFQDGDKSRTQMALELTALREELARVRDEDVQELTDVRKAIKDFTLTTQMELETEVARLETRCTVAEEQLKASNEYLSEATVKYQVEIMRLREVVAKHAPEALTVPQYEAWDKTKRREELAAG